MAKQKRNPRIMVAFGPAQYDLLKRLAQLEDKPMAQVLKALFVQVEPMLREMVVALEAARDAQGKPAAQLIAAMSRLQSTVEEATQAAVNQGDMFSGAIQRTTSKLKKRSAKPSVKPSGKRSRAKG